MRPALCGSKTSEFLGYRPRADDRLGPFSACCSRSQRVAKAKYCRVTMYIKLGRLTLRTRLNGLITAMQIFAVSKGSSRAMRALPVTLNSCSIQGKYATACSADLTIRCFIRQSSSDVASAPLSL
jgi:hypothetical protein